MENQIKRGKIPTAAAAGGTHVIGLHGMESSAALSQCLDWWALPCVGEIWFMFTLLRTKIGKIWGFYGGIFWEMTAQPSRMLPCGVLRGEHLGERPTSSRLTVLGSPRHTGEHSPSKFCRRSEFHNGFPVIVIEHGSRLHWT